MSFVPARALPFLRPIRFVLDRPSLTAALFFWATWGEIRLVITLSGVAHVPITGNHVHHLVLGALLLLAAATLDVLKQAPRLRPVLLGVGAALLLDEFALIWNLRDVYWSRAGHVSVLVTAAFGVVLTLVAGGELLRERRQRSMGLPGLPAADPRPGRPSIAGLAVPTGMDGGTEPVATHLGASHATRSVAAAALAEQGILLRRPRE
jgi:hypothetical protein